MFKIRLFINRQAIIVLSVGYTMILFLLILIFVISRKMNIPVANLTGDPASILNSPSYIGLLSNMGIVLWSFTCAICFFSSVVQNKFKRSEESSFFVFFGFLTFILLIDDLFMVHDRIFPGYFKIGGELLYLVYFIYTIFIFIRFGKFIILRTEYLVLLIACVFFSLSILFDLFMNQSHSSINYLIEDGFKFLGIFTFFIFFSRTGYYLIVGK